MHALTVNRKNSRSTTSSDHLSSVKIEENKRKQELEDATPETSTAGVENPFDPAVAASLSRYPVIQEWQHCC